jgi:hypothetical protein
LAIDTPQAILEFADARAKQSWEKFKKPILLSLLGSELSVLNPDYNELIEPLKLREFLTANADENFSIIQHPHQKAKVGLIPTNETFAFPVEEKVELTKLDRHTRTEQSGHRRAQGKYVVQNFLDLLSNLEAEDVERVQIPIDVIAKMIRLR